jgi:hypothetical protein
VVGFESPGLTTVENGIDRDGVACKKIWRLVSMSTARGILFLAIAIATLLVWMSSRKL